MSKNRSIIFKIIIVFTSTFIFLFLIDKFFNRNKEVLDYNNYILYNDSINASNKKFADDNPFGFTDYIRTEEKPDTVFRVAVIGDSFIWGDGLPFEKVWSHKLGAKLKELNPNIETLSWGINGWSTKDEYNFYINNGYRFNIDLMLFGFVHNDPDMGDFKHLNPEWYNRLNFMFKIFPQLTGTVLDFFYNRSYARWIEKLYKEENLKNFSKLLGDIKKLEIEHHLKIAFILTPSAINEKYEELFPKIETLLKNEDVDYINLYPIMKEKLSGVHPDSLKANPANSHPGDKLTEFYAEQALEFIIKKNLLGAYTENP